MSRKYEASDIVHKFVQYLVMSKDVKQRPSKLTYQASDTPDSESNVGETFRRDPEFSLKTSMFSDTRSIEDVSKEKIELATKKSTIKNQIQKKLNNVLLMKIIRAEEFIHPSDDFKVKFDILVMSLALFNCAFVPIQVSFQPKALENPYFEMANFVIDFMFLIDILINFRTIFINNKGEEISDAK